MFTFSNFITRFGITLTFVALFTLLPIDYAAAFCTLHILEVTHLSMYRISGN
jgi:hypothetical protein